MDTLRPIFLKAQNGDANAYGIIVQRFQDMAVGYGYAVLGDFHLAEDVAQETFVEAFRYLSNVSGPWSRCFIWAAMPIKTSPGFWTCLSLQ